MYNNLTLNLSRFSARQPEFENIRNDLNWTMFNRISPARGPPYYWPLFPSLPPLCTTDHPQHFEGWSHEPLFPPLCPLRMKTSSVHRWFQVLQIPDPWTSSTRAKIDSCLLQSPEWSNSDSGWEPLWTAYMRAVESLEHWLHSPILWLQINRRSCRRNQRPPPNEDNCHRSYREMTSGTGTLVTRCHMSRGLWWSQMLWLQQKRKQPDTAAAAIDRRSHQLITKDFNHTLLTSTEEEEKEEGIKC